MVLGAILAVIGFGHSRFLACVIARLGGRLGTGARIARIRQRATGTLFVGLGLLLAFELRS